MVGEQASNPLVDPDQRPFCTDRGCSGWLNRQLDASAIDERLLYWVNALHNDGRPADLRSLVDRLQPTRTFALGLVAQRACANAGLAYEAHYHPQYWKRFKSKYSYPAITHLAEVLNKLPAQGT